MAAEWQKNSIENPVKPYSKGNKVLLNGKHIDTAYPKTKLAPKWWGPFTIEKVLGPVTYQLKLPTHWNKIHPVFHASRLKQFNETEEYGPPHELPLPDIIEGEEFYEVETIITNTMDKRRKNPYLYKVKWKGYPYSDATWEPLENLITPQGNAEDIVREFHKKNPKAPKPPNLEETITQLKTVNNNV